MCDLFLKRVWFGTTFDQIGVTFLENQLSNKEYLSLNGMLSLVLVVTAKTLGVSFLVKPMPCWGTSSLFDIRGLMKELCHLVHKCRVCYSLSCLLVKMRCTHVLFLSPFSILGCVQSCGLFSGRRHGPTPRMWPSPSRLWWERWATTWSGSSGAPLRPERRRASWSWGRSGSCRNSRAWITRRSWVWKRSWSSRPGRLWTGTGLRRANAAPLRETHVCPPAHRDCGVTGNEGMDLKGANIRPVITPA